MESKLTSKSEKDFEGSDFQDKKIPEGDLTDARFQGSILKNCDFSGRDLSYADFSGADLYRANLRGATLYSTVFRGSDLTRADFRDAHLYGIKLFDADVTRSEFDKIVYEERVGRTTTDFNRAADVYNTLKRAFKEHGEVATAAHYYYRQRVCQRRSRSEPIARLLDLVFLDWLVGYGEKPVRSVFWSVILIFVFSLAYIALPHLGVGAASTLAGENSTLTIGSIYQFPLALELSITAFVGADLVDWELAGIARGIMAFEALLGAVMLSIILIGFSRKIVRD